MNKYISIDQQLHWICQILAKANRTYVPKKDDDSHTNLYYDYLGNRILGRKIKTSNSELFFTFNLANQEFEIINQKNQILVSIQTISFDICEIESNIEKILPTLGLNEEGFSSELHFEIPNYYFSDKTIQLFDKNDIIEWGYFRQMANEACFLLLGHAQVLEEPRIWPHHFDTGIYAKVSDNLDIGFGLAMADEMIETPYFYFSGFTNHKTMEYTNLPESKEWRWVLGEHWKGVVLPLNEIKNKTKSEQMSILSKYIVESFHWFLKNNVD